MHALLESVPTVDLTAGGVVGALDPRALLSGLGAFGVFLILFAETGLLIGFFLPGDSLLFTAGLLCTSAGSLHLSLPWVLIAAAGGALLGAQVGFVIGRHASKALDAHADRPRLAAGLRRAEELFTRYGPAK